jgi:hypothetical protein
MRCSFSGEEAFADTDRLLLRCLLLPSPTTLLSVFVAEEQKKVAADALRLREELEELKEEDSDLSVIIDVTIPLPPLLLLVLLSLLLLLLL